MTHLVSVARYLQRFQLNPAQPWTLAHAEELLELADWYRACRDPRSAWGCLYLYTALKHPPPTDCPATVELGREVLDAWIHYKREASESA